VSRDPALYLDDIEDACSASEAGEQALLALLWMAVKRGEELDDPALVDGGDQVRTVGADEISPAGRPCAEQTSRTVSSHALGSSR
jgi:hypothetical protein